jgi:hypothetical protein
MTVPDERSRALVYTRAFLKDLRDPGVTPRVPKNVRDTAGWLLRHYPEPYVIEIAHKAAPGWYGPVPKNQHWREEVPDALDPRLQTPAHSSSVTSTVAAGVLPAADRAVEPYATRKPHLRAVNNRPGGKK